MRDNRERLGNLGESEVNKATVRRLAIRQWRHDLGRLDTRWSHLDETGIPVSRCQPPRSWEAEYWAAVEFVIVACVGLGVVFLVVWG